MVASSTDHELLDHIYLLLGGIETHYVYILLHRVNSYFFFIEFPMGIKQLLRQKRTYETYNTRFRTEETNKRQIKQKEFIVSSCTKRKYGER